MSRSACLPASGSWIALTPAASCPRTRTHTRTHTTMSALHQHSPATLMSTAAHTFQTQCTGRGDAYLGCQNPR